MAIVTLTKIASVVQDKNTDHTFKLKAIPDQRENTKGNWWWISCEQLLLVASDDDKIFLHNAIHSGKIRGEVAMVPYRTGELKFY